MLTFYYIFNNEVYNIASMRVVYKYAGSYCTSTCIWVWLKWTWTVRRKELRNGYTFQERQRVGQGQEMDNFWSILRRKKRTHKPNFCHVRFLSCHVYPPFRHNQKLLIGFGYVRGGSTTFAFYCIVFKTPSHFATPGMHSLSHYMFELI